MGAPSKHKIHTETYQNYAINYKKHLDILGLNHQTTQTRYLYLKEFFSWLEYQYLFKIEEVTTQDISSYHEYLKVKISQRTNLPIKQKSRYDHMRNLQQFLGHLLDLGIIKSSPASHLKFTNPTEKVERYIFTQNQIKELYRVANNQEIALLHIGYGCGLRVQELSDLNKVDIRITERLIIVEKGKNSKRRLVPISKKVAEELELFIFSNENKSNAIFINNKGYRMQEWTFNSLLKKLIKRTDFGNKLPAEALCKIGIHNLRHSIATHLLANGMKLEQVQTFLGHSHIESTEIYTHISQNQINNLYDNSS
ncbi:MAG: tyrosine-type recombinase/integrase [Flavobacteriaceae bacterium]|nr:MAG: tyrosine-type recombinase/integrase [Flavobacteriaceae bacterium]QMU66259.1 MAG: tyrosine-type recombinase/integrase [Flavobacteriaceae bacterium]